MQYSELLVQRIHELCNRKKPNSTISINHLAEMSGLRQSTVNNIMQGNSKNPKIKTLHKIALAFNMTLADFLNFEALNEYSFEDDPEEESDEETGG